MTPDADRGESDRQPRTVAAPDPAAVPDVDLLVVDNYDSFAYNLVQYVGELAGDVTVRRNDAIDLAAVRDLEPDGVVVSPGPGRPEDAGVSMDLFEEPELPVLGVCLGHQALCAAYGSPVEQAPAVLHGKPSAIEHDGAGLYRSLPDRLRVGRYHSLVVRRAALPESLEATAWTVPAASGHEDERSVLMGVRHRERPHYGVQFHPESILTGSVDEADAPSLAVGKRLVATFCELVAERRRGDANGDSAGKGAAHRDGAGDSDGDDAGRGDGVCDSEGDEETHGESDANAAADGVGGRDA